MLFISDSSCKRVLSLSCGLIFPPMFPVLFRNFLGFMNFCHWLSEMLPLDV